MILCNRAVLAALQITGVVAVGCRGERLTADEVEGVRGSHKFKLGIGELLWRWTLVSTIPFQSYEPLTACFGEG